MKRQYCLWRRVDLGLCSHGHRNYPGSCQEPCSSPSPWHAVGWMLKMWHTPCTGDIPGHNPAWPCSSQQQHEGFYPSCSVPPPDQCRHPAPPHHHEQRQQVKGEQGHRKHKSPSQPEEKLCKPTRTPGISGVPISLCFASGQNIHRARRVLL